MSFTFKFDHNREDGATMITNTHQSDFEEISRLAAMSVDERFRLYHVSARMADNGIPPAALNVECSKAAEQPKESSQTRISDTPVILLPINRVAVFQQENFMTETTAMNVYGGTHISEYRGGAVVSAKNETTEILYHLFAAARNPNVKYHLKDRYVMIASTTHEIESDGTKFDGRLTEAEEDLVYVLLTEGVRTGERVVRVPITGYLKARGIDPYQAKNREASRQSLKKLSRSTIFVSNQRAKKESPFKFFDWRGTERNAFLEAKLSNELLSLFDEPSFPALFAKRSLFQIRGTFRTVLRLVPDRRSKEGRDAEILKVAMKQAELRSSQKSKISFVR
ncbi:MAG: hypothetical protein WCI45_09505 [Desulfuromonadales bacterium]